MRARRSFRRVGFHLLGELLPRRWGKGECGECFDHSPSQANRNAKALSREILSLPTNEAVNFPLFPHFPRHFPTPAFGARQQRSRGGVQLSVWATPSSLHLGSREHPLDLGNCLKPRVHFDDGRDLVRREPLHGIAVQFLHPSATRLRTNGDVLASRAPSVLRR